MSTPGMKLEDFVSGTSRGTSRMLIADDRSFGGVMKVQAARQWIPQAGVARRLHFSPRAMIRQLVDCG